jgi:hypothetical protein
MNPNLCLLARPWIRVFAAVCQRIQEALWESTVCHTPSSARLASRIRDPVFSSLSKVNRPPIYLSIIISVLEIE